MSEQRNLSNPNYEPEFAHTLLYRGVSADNDRSRIGAWWTTNPFYALSFANGENGRMYVARVDTVNLSFTAHDVSQDEGYENYGFIDDDPEAARLVTQEETNALLTVSQGNTTTRSSDLPGGPLMKTPDNPVEIGKQVFEDTFN